MKKLVLLALSVILGTAAISARQNLLVKKFDYATSAGENYAHALRNKVMEGIAERGRVKVLDVATDDGVEADNILDGHLISITYVKSSDSKGATYTAKVNYSLKVTRVSDNEVINNKTFEASSPTFMSTYRTQGDAAAAAINYAGAQMKDWVDEVFKSVGKIIEVSEVKKDEAKMVYISIGSEEGIQKGQKLDVKVEKTVAGRPISKVIGEIKVEAVEGEDVSLCKVTKNGKAIQAAMAETPDAVTVVTKVNGNILGL